jgi:TatD DNase family protein
MGAVVEAAGAALFDSHCHLDFGVFDADRAQVLDRARLAGVERLFVPGVTPDQWSRLGALQARHPEVALGVGLHPYFLHQLSSLELKSALRAIPTWCDRLSAVAVGECGLDANTARRGGAPLQLQCDVLLRHLQWANALKLPVVLHVVRAHGRLLELLRGCPPVMGGVLHSYSGSVEMVGDYAALGLYFGFGGAVTRSGARRAREALIAVPEERLLLETDAPDQSPQGWASRNEPATTALVAREAAQLTGMDLKELALLTSRNAARLYRLDPCLDAPPPPRPPHPQP